MKFRGYSRGYRFKPGDRVRSHFRAQWTGVILGYCDGTNGPMRTAIETLRYAWKRGTRCAICAGGTRNPR